MLKKFWIPVILCVIVILTGCDQGIPKMMKPVLTPELTTVEQPISEAEAQGTVYPEITFENALNLTPGLYRLRPTSYDDWDKGGFGDRVLTRLYWGMLTNQVNC